MKVPSGDGKAGVGRVSHGVKVGHHTDCQPHPLCYEGATFGVWGSNGSHPLEIACDIRAWRHASYSQAQGGGCRGALASQQAGHVEHI